MEHIPLEILWLILDFLPRKDVARLSVCNRELNSKITPFLYRVLRIGFRKGFFIRSTLIFLNVLCRQPRLASFIREVDIVNFDSRLWSPGHSELLAVILSATITHREPISSFSTTVEWIPLGGVFPNLNSLTCLQIHTDTELEWVRWHLLNCSRLTELHLRLPAFEARLGHRLLENVNLAAITKLSLDGICIANGSPLKNWTPHTLDLRLCPGTEAFLEPMISAGQLNSLRVFRLVTHLTQECLGRLLRGLSKCHRLEELSLRLGDAVQPIAIHKYLVSHLLLRSLVFDLRGDITAPETSLKLNIKEMQRLIEACPKLEFLGLTVDLRNPRYQRYRRLKYSVSRSQSISITSFILKRIR